MSRPHQVLFPCHSTQWIHSLQHRKSCNNRTFLRHSLGGLRKIVVSSCWHFLGMVSPLNGNHKQIIPVTILGLDLQQLESNVRDVREDINCGLSFFCIDIVICPPAHCQTRSIESLPTRGWAKIAIGGPLLYITLFTFEIYSWFWLILSCLPYMSS